MIRSRVHNPMCRMRELTTKPSSAASKSDELRLESIVRGTPKVGCFVCSQPFWCSLFPGRKWSLSLSVVCPKKKNPSPFCLRRYSTLPLHPWLCKIHIGWRKELRARASGPAPMNPVQGISKQDASHFSRASHATPISYQMRRTIFDMLVLPTQFHSKWEPAVPKPFGPMGPWERHRLQNLKKTSKTTNVAITETNTLTTRCKKTSRSHKET